MLAALMTVLTGLGAVGATAPPPQKEGVPLKKELFGNEAWYKSQKGEEKEFVGILSRVERGKNVVGFGRFNPYRLTMETNGKKDVREVYVGGKMELLAPYVGKQVKLVGKAVDMEVEGQMHREIWPARLEVLEPKKTPATDAETLATRIGIAAREQAAGKEVKVVAQGPWQYVSANPDGPKEGKQLVIRSAKELAALPPWNNLDAPQQVVEKMATDAVAKALKVGAIDWGKQMLVVVTAGVKPTGGYRVEVDQLSVQDNTLTVNWTLHTPSGFVTQAFTHPARAALVERFDGQVKFAMKVVSKKK